MSSTNPETVLAYLDEHADAIAAMLDGLALSPTDAIAALRSHLVIALPQWTPPDTLTELEQAIADHEHVTNPDARVIGWLLVIESMPSPDAPPTSRGYRVTTSPTVQDYTHARGLGEIAADLVRRGDLS